MQEPYTTHYKLKGRIRVSFFLIPAREYLFYFVAFNLVE